MMLKAALVATALCAAGLIISNAEAVEIKPGIVTISLGSDVESMDPHAISSALSSTLRRYVFDTLMNKPKGATTPEPWAAESVEYIDPTTLEVRMREGVKFTNGEDVDAEAVKFSLERPEQPGFKTVQGKVFRNVEDIEVVSKWVLRIKLDAPDPGFINRISDWGNLVPPKYYADISQEDAAIKPVGSGPYKLVRWEKDVEMVFEANPDYWNDDLTLIKTVRVVPIKEPSTKVNALLSGEVNLINQVPPQFVPQIEDNPGTKMGIDKGTRIFHLGFTHGIDAPFSDIRVRRAIAYAINRDVIVKNVVEGFGNVANSPLHDWTEGHDPNREARYPYDPEKAKQLLAEAGYKDGVEINFYAPAGRYTKDKAVSEAIVGFLQAVGIKANYQPLTWGRFVEVFRAKDEPGAEPFMYYIGYGNGGGDTDRTLNAIAACGGAWSGYCNPQIDAELDKALGTIDLKERYDIFHNVVDQMIEDVSHVFLWQEDALYGMTDDIDWDVRNDDRVFAWEIDKK